jgi:hypothetical protein
MKASIHRNTQVPLEVRTFACVALALKVKSSVRTGLHDPIAMNKLGRRCVGFELEVSRRRFDAAHVKLNCA